MIAAQITALWCSKIQPVALNSAVNWALSVTPHGKTRITPAPQTPASHHFFAIPQAVTSQTIVSAEPRTPSAHLTAIIKRVATTVVAAPVAPVKAEFPASKINANAFPKPANLPYCIVAIHTMTAVVAHSHVRGSALRDWIATRVTAATSKCNAPMTIAPHSPELKVRE